MRHHHFDLVIVGASFAGLACARTAALRGLKVAVLDAKSEPGARVRTTGILVKEATDDFDVPAHLTRKVRGVKLYAPSGKALALSAPGYYFQTTDTAEMLRWMAGEAQLAGAQLFFDARFDGANETKDGVEVLPHRLTAEFLIGADGARSRVADVFKLGRNTRFLAGLEIETPPLADLDPRFLHCFADSTLAAGYIGWAVPGVGVTQIGVAATRGKKPELAQLIDRLRAMWGLDTLQVLEKRSGLIPSGGPVSQMGRGRVLLIGDAAGLVSPVTGGGIHTALHFGRRAAQIVGEYLCDRGEHPVSVFARETPKYRAKRLLRRALDLAPPNALIDLALMTPPMRALAQRLYFHRRGGDPASFEAWTEAMEKDDMEPVAPEISSTKLHCI
jgi:digeranylgeranylglycerophospholipid reductase